MWTLEITTHSFARIKICLSKSAADMFDILQAYLGHTKSTAFLHLMAEIAVFII